MNVIVLSYLLVGAAMLPVVRKINGAQSQDSFTGTLEQIRYPNGKRLLGKVEDASVWIAAWAIATAFWPLLIAWAAYEHFKTNKTANGFAAWKEEDDEVERFSASLGNLASQCFVDDVELAELVADPLGAVPAVPFGHLNSAWEGFKSQMQPGDEIWSFQLPDAERTWSRRIARGYAIKRGGEIVAEVASEAR